MAKKNNTKEPKQPGGATPSIIIQQLSVRKANRAAQDVPKWRAATRAAESINPRRTLLYDFYADVEIDGHVEAVTSKRRDAVTLSNWQFVDKNKEPVEEINQLLDTFGFSEILDEIINSRFWGYTMLEPKFWKNADEKWEVSAGVLPRLHYRPEAGIVTFQRGGEDGVNVREGVYAKTVMEVGKVDDLGLYLKAGLYYVLKRGGLGDWAGMIQTWGQALIDALWDGVDDTQRVRLEETLNGVGQGGNIVRPAGTELTVHQPPSKDTGNSHGEFMKFLNNEISKSLLGTTETTESSGSSGYAQSKTHSEEDDNKHMSDVQFTRRILNSRFIKILNAAGFDTKGGEFVVQGEEAELSKGESFEIHKSMASELGVPIADDFWYDTYNVPKPENYDALKEAAAEENKVDPEKGDPDDPGKDPDPKDPKPKDPKAEEKEKEVQLSEKAWYLKLYEYFFPKASAVTTGAALEPCSHHHTITLSDAENIDSDGLIRRVWARRGKGSFDAALYRSTAGILLSAFRNGWRGAEGVRLGFDLGFEYGNDDPALITAFERNLFRFAGAKTLAQIQELNQLFKQSSSFEEFYQLAKSRTEIYNKEWLATEYNTAVLTAEAAATYHRLIAQAEIFPYWMYKTAGDDLVRPEHAYLEGLILPYNDPRWKKLFPPNGWNCRCYIVPRMAHEFNKANLAEMRERADAYLNSPQGKKETATGWGVNRVASGEVFTVNQQYVRKFAGKASKDLNALKFHDYGLESYSQARKVGILKRPDYQGDAKAFYDSLDDTQKGKALRDYNNRPLSINEKNFTRHSIDDRKRRAHRTSYLQAMREALKQPDEVWLNGKQLDNLVYVKYYKGETMIAIGNIKNGHTELKSWFVLADKKATIAEYRRGLLVYKK